MQFTEEEAKRWPPKITIGTKNAYQNQKFYTYTRVTIKDEPCYLCDKGSTHSRGNERLLLRCERSDTGEMMIWTAFDTYIDTSSGQVICRQAVFRAVDQHIQEAGKHHWQTNLQAHAHNNGELSTDKWSEPRLEAETRVFSHATPM